MGLGRRGEKGIQNRQRAAGSLAAGHDLSPGVGDRGIDDEDSALEAKRQLFAEPEIQLVPPGAGRQPLDAVSKFGQSHDAQEDAIFVGLSQPGDYAGIGARLRPLGNDRGIEQKFTI